MKRIKIIFAAIVCAAALISCSKEMDQKRENTGGEIKTLSFGIDQSTKSTLTLGADGAMKMGWNAGDRIFVAKGEKVYIYKLSSTGSDGKGVFTAEGKGVPDLTGNTEKVSIYHLGTDLNVDNVKTTNNLSGLSVEIGGGEQTGNGTFAHLAQDCILERVLETPPTTVKELEGKLMPKTSILTFEIPAPTTPLAEGEIPTSAILTVCSSNTSFAGTLKATDQGVTIDRKVKKLQVILKETGSWNATTPLKVSFNVLMDDFAAGATDAWIVEVQTNKRKVYTSDKLTIKNKPAVGAYYNASITSVKEETSLPCYATFEDDINAIKKEIHAVFQDSYSCAYNYSFLNQVYASILIEDESGNPVFDYYVESGKGGEGGKGGAFLGDGLVNVILYPGKTYTITPYIVIEQNIVYFGTAKSYTPTGSISFASGDLGLSVIWADKNVGADKTEDVGGYYAWGVTDEYAAPFTYKWFNEDGSKAKKYVSQKSNSESGTADGLTVLKAEDDVASVKLGGVWRMPTKEEIDELKELDCLEDYELNGKKGLLFVGNGDNGLFIPYGGYKDKSDTPVSTDYAYLWSSSLVTASSSAPEYIDYGAYTLQNIVEGHVGWKTTDIAALRSSARNVRGVKAR